jgi:hypothetical protein
VLLYPLLSQKPISCVSVNRTDGSCWVADQHNNEVVHLAANGRLRGLFLQNPPPLAQLIRGRYGWWNLWLLAGPIAWGVPCSLDTLANARSGLVQAQFDYHTAHANLLLAIGGLQE